MYNSVVMIVRGVHVDTKICCEIQNNHYGPPRTMLLVGKTNEKEMTQLRYNKKSKKNMVTRATGNIFKIPHSSIRSSLAAFTTEKIVSKIILSIDLIRTNTS